MVTDSGATLATAGAAVAATGNTAGAYGSEVTLKAIWTAGTYTVSLDLNSKTAGNTGYDTSFSVTYDGTLPGITTQPTTVGYTLEGWYAEQACTTKVLNADGTVANANVNGYITDSKWTKAEDTTLYANWTAKTITVTLNNEGGTGGTESFTIAYMSSTTTPATITVPTKTGYAFAGWSMNEDDTTAQYITTRPQMLSISTPPPGTIRYRRAIAQWDFTTQEEYRYLTPAEKVITGAATTLTLLVVVVVLFGITRKIP